MASASVRASCAYCGGPIPGGTSTSPSRFCCYGCRVLGEEVETGVSNAPAAAGASNPWFRIGVGAFLAAQSMLFGLASNLTQPEGASRTVIHAGLAASAAGAIAVLGPPMVREACDCARSRRVAIEWLFLLGVIGAFGASLLASIRGTGAVYYEVVAVLLTVYAAGKALTASARGRALMEGRRFADRFSVANRIGPDGREESVDVRTVRIGDRVRVVPGGAVPVDGRVVAGTAFVRETALTGEPFPVVRRSGDEVLAGAISEDGALEVIALRGGTERRLDGLLGDLETAQQGLADTRAQAFVDKASRWFIPVVLAISAATFAGWAPRLGWEEALYRSLSVLLVACPCALGLATPLALWNGLSILASRGVVLRSAGALERLAAVRWVVFDKTGTLSGPDPVLADFVSDPLTDRARLLACVGALESRSGHPIGRAFPGRVLPDGLVLDEVTVVPGCGVKGRFSEGEGRRFELAVGRPDWLGMTDAGPAWAAAAMPSEIATAHRVAIAMDGRLCGLALIREQVRTDWEGLVERLGREGKQVAILSGDRGERLESFRLNGRVVVQGGLDARQKAEWIRSRRGAGEGVLYVGDGINDATALAEADVGLAVGDGTDLARACAGGVLAGGNPSLVVEAIGQGRLVMERVRGSLWFAGVYNGIGVGLAATGLLHPVAAAILMVGSSSIVAWRALRPERCDVPATGEAKWIRWGLAGALGAQLPAAILLGPLDWRQAAVVASALGGLAAWVLGIRVLRPGLRMSLGMLGPGNLLMLAGWWADAGFRQVMQEGVCLCCQSHRFFEIGLRVPWMHLGMLAGGMPFMWSYLGRLGSRGARVGAMVATAVAMVWGMNAGADIVLRLGGPGHSWQFLLAWAGMTAGMLGGMFLVCGAQEALLQARATARRL